MQGEKQEVRIMIEELHGHSAPCLQACDRDSRRLKGLEREIDIPAMTDVTYDTRTCIRSWSIFIAAR
jgi:hypothetical protein